MIPIRDINPTKTFPYVTLIFIIVNVYLFSLQSSLPGISKEFYYFNRGIIPKCLVSMFNSGKYDEALEETKISLKVSIAKSVVIRKRMRLTYAEAKKIDQIVEDNFKRKVFGIGGWFAEIMSLFTSMFIHGGLAHLIGNMWFLWIFGNNIEDAMGILKFVAFYFATGILAAMGHVVFSLNSVIPTIGASGAISGVLGAYMLFYPRAEILTFIPLGWFFWLEDFPAYIFVGYWVVIQIVFGFVLRNPLLGGGGIAYIAHISGFFWGALIVLILARKKVKLFKPVESI